jgi:hypothetical protein
MLLPSFILTALLSTHATAGLLSRRDAVPDHALLAKRAASASASLPKAEFSVPIGKKLLSKSKLKDLTRTGAGKKAKRSKNAKKAELALQKKATSGSTTLVGGDYDWYYTIPVTIGNQSVFLIMDTGSYVSSLSLSSFHSTHLPS